MAAPSSASTFQQCGHRRSAWILPAKTASEPRHRQDDATDWHLHFSKTE